MAYPTSYTEQTLGDYVFGQLGDIAGLLSWSSLADVQPAIDEALAKCSVSDIASITGADSLAKLRTLARYEGWALAVRSLAAQFDFKAGEQDFKRSQSSANAEKELARAKEDAQPYLDEIGPAAGFDQYGQTYNMSDLEG